MHDYTSGPADLSYPQNKASRTLHGDRPIFLDAEEIAALLATLLVRQGISTGLKEVKEFVEDFLLGIRPQCQDFSDAVGVDKITMIMRVRYLAGLAGTAQSNPIENRMRALIPR